MLDIELEFYKGILFVRLGGCLNKNNISKFKNEVLSFIKKTGIRNIVFNLTNLNELDLDGEVGLYNSYKASYINNGNTLLCGLNDEISKSKLLKNIKRTRGEIEAINIINA